MRCLSDEMFQEKQIEEEKGSAEKRGDAVPK